MNSILTKDEIAFLEKKQRQKDKAKLSRDKYKSKIKNEIQQTNKDINIDTLKDIEDIKPSCVKRLESSEPLPLLEQITIKGYLNKLSVINQLILNKPLNNNIINELINLFNNNDYNEEILLNEISYINNDIFKTIDILRNHYYNNNTFKTYINVLAIITSHFKTINPDIYQILAKTYSFISKDVNNERKLNILDDYDKQKLIKINIDEFYKNVVKLHNIDDKLIYALYFLMPARRLEWRSVILTDNSSIDELNVNNFLIINTEPKQIIFNDYKTKKYYKKQYFDIPNDLNIIIDEYIKTYNLKPNDYLFGLQKNKSKCIAQSNFSFKISKVYYDVYNIPISIRFIRMSHISQLIATNPNMATMEILAEQMGHGINEQRLYNKR